MCSSDLADGCSDADGGEEVCGGAVVPGCDPAEVFEPAKAAFYGVAVTVEIRREAVLPAPVGFGRNVWRGTPVFDLPAHRVAVVALVAVEYPCRRHLFQQDIGSGAIRNLSAGQQERDGAAEAIGQRVDFRRAPAA